MSYRVHFTLVSSNSKTGPIPVSTSSRQWCPDTCPLKAAGCYAKGGPMAIHWNAVTQGKRGDLWADFVSKVRYLPEGQLWRHNQAGDLPGDGEVLDLPALGDLIAANQGKRGFTYTHYPVLGDSIDRGINRTAIGFANDNGFTINLSANNLAHADELAALDIAPVVTLLPEDAAGEIRTPAGRRVVICPATQREGVTCATCQLCQRQRSTIVGFPAHGSGKRAATAIAEAA